LFKNIKLIIIEWKYNIYYYFILIILSKIKKYINMQNSAAARADEQGVVAALLDSETLSLIAQKLYDKDDDYNRRYINITKI
jgi:hypothetical protein